MEKRHLVTLFAIESTFLSRSACVVCETLYSSATDLHKGELVHTRFALLDFG